MIQLIPSLSVIGGKCVRLSQGNYEQKTVYKESPIEIARQFEDHGIKQIHLIDLDGTRLGSVKNFETLEMVKAYTNLKIDFAGGIKTDGDMTKAFEYGASMVTVGSLAISNSDLFSQWIISYGRNKITLSADALEGKIQIRGWQNATETDLFKHIEYYYNRSILFVKCSDVSRDGTMQGPNFSIYQKILEKFPGIKLLASGGIQSLDDIKQLQDMGVYGVIFGKAFYEGKITLKNLDEFTGKNSG